ncbi:POTRA domain-containing protein, partial [Allosphingosinicella sp.]|uniref:POTRA domain-containing protein n=1 Tax=Allosphingosinicella sp. TaxID=2823234 RepID=UPI002F0A71A9
MTAKTSISNRQRLCSALLVGTILGGIALPAHAQDAPAATAPAQAAPAPAADALPGTGIIRSISVTGNQRLEPETVISYMKLRTGEPYSRERLDEALQDLYRTELFANVAIGGADTGNIVIEVRE